MNRRTRTLLFTLAGVIVAVALLLGGFVLGMNPDRAGGLRSIFPASWSGSDQLQAEIAHKLESSFYKQVDPSALQVDAINGMVQGLDAPWTVYLNPTQYASLLKVTSGKYTGVGMAMELQQGLVVIIYTYKGSPSDLAGIKAGDLIVSVDGVSVQGLTLEDVATRVRGTEGTTVKIGMYRPLTPITSTNTTESATNGGSSESTTTSTTTTPTADLSKLPPGGTTTERVVTRQNISIPVTERKTVYAGTKQVALIAYSSFTENSADMLRAEVKKAVESDHVAAIILDLRGNGGGLLDEAVGVASIFIPSGVIVRVDARAPQTESDRVASGNAYSAIPLYVLIDRHTASASEIVSGALQDYKRATLIGETSFGKGLVQSIEPLSNGGALKVTTAIYLTPKDRNINKTGIAPDVVAPDDPTTPNVDETVQKALDLIAGAPSGQ